MSPVSRLPSIGDTGHASISQNVRTTKKGTVSENIVYDEKKKLFIVKDDKIASQVFINKSIYLEQKDLIELENRTELFRGGTSFNELLNKVFLEFGVKERNFEIHILKLYHILDLIAPVNLRTVLDVVFGNPAYIPSEKVHGVFYLDPSSISDLVEEDIKQKEIHDTQTRTDKDVERQHKIDEEKKVDEEIRLIREERRRKREEEMRKVEKIEKDRRDKIIKEQTRDKKSASPVGRREIPAAPVDPVPTDSDPTKIDRTKKEAAHKKKAEKEVFKPGKEKSTTKKSKKTDAEDQLDLEEIQSEIELLKLKDEVDKEKEKRLNKEKAKKVAFKDTSGFGGIFASKLDEITKSDKKEKKETKGKKEKK